MATVLASKTLVDFDENVTRRAFGYESVDAYYRDSSSANFIKSVGIPFLSLSALDDPICDVSAIPYEEFTLNPNTILATFPSGGHGMLFPYGSMAEESLSFHCSMDFVKGILEWRRKERLVHPDTIQSQLEQEKNIEKILGHIESIHSQLLSIS